MAWNNFDQDVSRYNMASQGHNWLITNIKYLDIEVPFEMKNARHHISIQSAHFENSHVGHLSSDSLQGKV